MQFRKCSAVYGMRLPGETDSRSLTVNSAEFWVSRAFEVTYLLCNYTNDGILCFTGKRANTFPPSHARTTSAFDRRVQGSGVRRSVSHNTRDHTPQLPLHHANEASPNCLSADLSRHQSLSLAHWSVSSLQRGFQSQSPHHFPLSLHPSITLHYPSPFSRAYPLSNVCVTHTFALIRYFVSGSQQGCKLTAFFAYQGCLHGCGKSFKSFVILTFNKC